MNMNKKPFMKNIKQIGFDDLNGKPAFQMAMQKVDEKYYLYTALFWRIMDGISWMLLTLKSREILSGWKAPGFMM